MQRDFIIAVCGIVFLVVLNIVLLFHLKSEKEYVRTAHQQYVEQLNVEQSKFQVLFQNQLRQYDNEGMRLPDFYLKEIEVRDSFPASALIGDKTVLFFRFKETHCDVCVNKFMELLATIPDDFPAQNLVLLCGYGNVHEYRTFVRKNKLRMQVFNVQEISGLPIERHDKPYFFVLDKELRIKNVFVPDEHNPDYMNRYLAFIKDKYWHK